MVKARIRKPLTLLYTSLFLFTMLLPLMPTKKAHALRPITFPVLGGARYSNDYYVPRPSPRNIHGATDIMANKGQPVVSPVDGIVDFVSYPQPSYGYMVSIKDSDGYTYNMLHLNDDNPGTNDGKGGAMKAYAPDMKAGNVVRGGQLIGWVGDSGNSNGVPHLHFEIEDPNGGLVNPYEPLNAAWRLPWPNTSPAMPNEILPYGAGFGGGLNIAMGNFDADTASEIVTGAGAGGSAHVKVFDNNNAFTGVEFMAYDPRLPIGTDIAAGDVDGDGTDEIITGAGPGAAPHVRIIKTNAQEINGFYAYDPSFKGGVRVAAGDVDGDGKVEVITGAASGGSPHVRVFKANGTELFGFYAYSPTFGGGIDVGAADISGASTVEIITSPGPGGGPQIRIFGEAGIPLSSFFAYDPAFTGGVKVSAGNVKTSTSKSEILTIPASNGGPHMRMFDGSGSPLSSKMFMEVWWYGFNDVGAGYDSSKAATGLNRRASVRLGL